MPYPTFDDVIPFTISQGQRLLQFVAYLIGFLSKEHKDDGTHGNVTVDSLTVNTGGYINGTTTLDLRVGGTSWWTVNSTGDFLPSVDETQDIGTVDIVCDHVYSKAFNFGNPANGVLDSTHLTFVAGAAIASGGSSNLSVTAAGTGTLTLTDGSNGGVVKIATAGSSSRVQWASNETTGGGSAALGTNSPAITNTAPYTWLKLRSADGSDVFIPAWK